MKRPIPIALIVFGLAGVLLGLLVWPITVPKATERNVRKWIVRSWFEDLRDAWRKHRPGERQN
jgi:hypothetical protein